MSGLVTLKLSVLLSESQKPKLLCPFGHASPKFAAGVAHTLYSPPELGVSLKSGEPVGHPLGAQSWTGVSPLLGSVVPTAWKAPGVADPAGSVHVAGAAPAGTPVIRPPETTICRQVTSSAESKTAPLGSVTWK